MVSVLLALAVFAAPVQVDPAALFARGVTFDAFMTTVQAQRTTWTQNAGRAEPAPDLVARLKKVSANLKILVVSDAACSDSVNVVPYLAKLASLAQVELRLIDKTTGTPIMAAHRVSDGRAATPTVILLRQGKEVAAWVERPAVLQNWYQTVGSKLASQDRLSRKLAWYDWDRGDTTLAEIVALAEKK